MIMKVREMAGLKQALYEVLYAVSSIYLTFWMHFICKSRVQMSRKMFMFAVGICRRLKSTAT